MFIARRTLEALIAIGGAAAIAAAVAGCGLVPTTRADCNVVRLQREAGRSDADIATALGVSEGDVSACGSAGAAEGAEGMGAAEGMGGMGGAPSAAEGGGGAGAPSDSGGENPPSNY